MPFALATAHMMPDLACFVPLSKSSELAAAIGLFEIDRKEQRMLIKERRSK
jgi:hypothetical protein